MHGDAFAMAPARLADLIDNLGAALPAAALLRLDRIAEDPTHVAVLGQARGRYRSEGFVSIQST